MKLDPLDRLFSQYIRMRAIKRLGGCERCLSARYDILKDDGSIFPRWKQLQCSHFHGRAKKSTRWDEDNAIGLCGACHMYLTAHPVEHVEFFKKLLGDKFDLLQARSKPEKVDKKLLMIYYREKIKEYEEG